MGDQRSHDTNFSGTDCIYSGHPEPKSQTESKQRNPVSKNQSQTKPTIPNPKTKPKCYILFNLSAYVCLGMGAPGTQLSAEVSGQHRSRFSSSVMYVPHFRLRSQTGLCGPRLLASIPAALGQFYLKVCVCVGGCMGVLPACIMCITCVLSALRGQEGTGSPRTGIRWF